MNQTSIKQTSLISDFTNNKLGVEYFHIYTDEKIERRHEVGLEYLKALEDVWSFEYEKIILIDNYNPVKHTLDAEAIIDYLATKNALPKYWAYEKDMIENSKTLLNAINNNKLKRSYEKYIISTNKYPCSLLTATWYLTRLGKLPSEDIIHQADNSSQELFKTSSRLINILPEDYRPIEERARKIILKSTFEEQADKIQDLFYPTKSDRTLALF
jgi:hypothetical protein